MAGGRGRGRRDPRPHRGSRRGPADQAAARLHNEKAARPRLYDHRRQPRLLGGERPRPCLPGASEDPPRSGRPHPGQDGVPAMSSPHPVCREIEPDLLAVASGEAAPAAAERVEGHVAGCGPCREELRLYRAAGALVGALRISPLPGVLVVLARTRLEYYLTEL